MHPATRGLPNQNVPTVILMTDDLANRQKAEKDGIVSISGAFTEVLFEICRPCSTVRKYVQDMRDSSQVLDLLSVAGSNDIEPTKAVAGRTALYPDVSPLLYCLFILLICSYISSTFLRRL